MNSLLSIRNSIVQTQNNKKGVRLKKAASNVVTNKKAIRGATMAFSKEMYEKEVAFLLV